MVQFGISLVNTLPIPQTVELVKAAEEAGFDQVSLVDAAPYLRYQDIMVSMTMALQATKKIKLASGVCIPYTRHPALLAAAFNSMDQLFPGRLILGLGPGGFLPLNALGIPLLDRPITAIRESFAILRSLFKGESLTYSGKLFKVNNVVLQPSPQKTIPLWLAARGPQMTRLVGELADGSFCSAPTSYIPHLMELIHEGAKKADRDLSMIRVGNSLPSALEEDLDTANDLVKHSLTYMVPATPEYVHKRIGTNLDEVKKLQEVSYRSLDEAKAFVTPFMLDNFTIRGSTEDINRIIDQQTNAGINTVIFGGPFATDPIKGIRELGRKVVAIHR